MLVCTYFKALIKLKEAFNKQGIKNNDHHRRNEDGDESFEHIENPLGLVIIKALLLGLQSLVAGDVLQIVKIG